MMRYLILLLLPFSACSQGANVNWMSFNQAMEASKTTKKKIFIDFYTDWCGWCKKMDAATFTDPEVVAYMNEHYYSVKFNAEKEGPIVIGDTTYAIMPEKGRNGTHGLAVTLLQGKMAYPSFVFLDENFNLLSPLPGYQTPEQIEGPLRYFGENHYQHESWTDFSKSFKPTF